ncbi:peptidoglycan-binding protein [Frankia sp. AgB1.9]|uniref:peptidoglycan-binding domain-containing protein n=1 Tax=unclassified Frankia TaxID=2632575 RepID=UPI0019316B59|nr:MULTISPECIES: peptidoglycan-binding domain-containing protein [unclassified Frankia]MBL7490477.1 peptidoglycan-binding protein [Frankia sp. AgW1.1]MBL7546657.1 peptidoglycan-binding protein [Frankia sp. AgB1.9]MBL7624673.1 peptidoglycan-binding protein [Frankia sp. AgB1.8]
MTAASALAWMAARAGTTEQPPGSNNVPGITDTLRTAAGTPMGPGPWCAAAVSLAIDAAGSTDLLGLQFAQGAAYVPYITVWARQRGKLLPPNAGRPGDLVIFVWPGGDPAGDHIGLLESVDLSRQTVGSWEGNADSDGDKIDDIGWHLRPWSVVLGVVRVTYPDLATVAPPPASPTWPPGFFRVLSLRTPRLAGADVTAYQRRMIARGWHGIGRVDGVFGPLCDKTTRQFQAEKRLVVDGLVGPATLAEVFRTDNIT